MRNMNKYQVQKFSNGWGVVQTRISVQVFLSKDKKEAEKKAKEYNEKENSGYYARRILA